MQVDFHLKNGKLLDVFNQKFIAADLWIKDGKIVFQGDSTAYQATETIDLQGKYVAPGLIDAHMHIESSLLAPSEIGRLLLRRGVTRIFADPHEIASVAGVAGIQYMLDEAKQTPLHIHYMLPSSVPATSFEHAGATLTAAHLKPFYEYPEVHGLAEVMDYPAVANGDEDMLQKIADARAAGRHIDGHGAGLTAEQLSVYRQVGIDTDHEAASVAMVNDRLAAGMSVFVREGTVERDEVALLPAINEQNMHRFAFCTDDKTANDLQTEGSIDYNVNIAVDHGLEMEEALCIASYNAAQAHHLQNVGALAAGYIADLVIFDDLLHFEAESVMVAGQWVDEQVKTEVLPYAKQALNIKLTTDAFDLPLKTGKAHVIGVEPQHITTQHLVADVPVDDKIHFKANQEYAKIAIFERYHQLGHGLGIIKGFEMKAGAIAATVAHDSHNLIVLGVDYEAMQTAVLTLREIGGGLVVVDDDGNTTSVPLVIGGLMSNQPYEVVTEQMGQLMAAFHKLSDVQFDPFICLSFMALPVIPSLKITDQGLFDFEQFKFIDINA